MTVSKDEKLIAFAQDDKNIMLFDWDQKKVIIKLFNDYDYVESMIFDPLNQYLIAVYRNIIRFWMLKNTDLNSSFLLLDSNNNNFFISPNGTILNCLDNGEI